MLTSIPIFFPLINLKGFQHVPSTVVDDNFHDSSDSELFPGGWGSQGGEYTCSEDHVVYTFSVSEAGSYAERPQVSSRGVSWWARFIGMCVGG